MRSMFCWVAKKSAISTFFKTPGTNGVMKSATPVDRLAAIPRSSPTGRFWTSRVSCAIWRTSLPLSAIACESSTMNLTTASNEGWSSASTSVEILRTSVDTEVCSDCNLLT